MKIVTTSLIEDTLACALAIMTLAVLALTLGAIWHTGTAVAVTVCVCGALLAYGLVWIGVPPGLAPLLAQGIGAVICVRLVAAVPLSSVGFLGTFHVAESPRATGWLLDMVDRAVGPDRVVFLLLLFLLWEVAYTVVWLILRERWAWAAIALAGASLVAASGAAGVVGPEIAFFAVPALVLVIWTTAIDYATVWRREAVVVARGARWPAVVAGVTMLILVGSLAWAWKPPSMAGVRGFPPSLPAGLGLPDLGNVLRGASSRITPPVTMSSAPAALTRALGQGGPVRLDRPFAPTGAIAAQVSGAVPSGARSMYWRGAIYDSYSDGVWQPAQGQSRLIPAQTTLQQALPGETTVTLHYLLPHAPAGVALISAGRLLRLSVDAQVSQSAEGLLASRAVATSGSGIAYDATSTWPPSGVPPAPPDQGWSAAQLQWPHQWPDVATLARRITAGSSGAQQQAMALEAYLRTHFTYDTQVGAPPEGQDPIQYFLFTSHQGYCNHFASALAMMARSLGLPARLVGGYVGGQADPAGGSVTLYDSDAHTWPEVYLPGRGWTLFEPTPGFGHPGAATVSPLRAGSAAGAVRPRPAVATVIPRRLSPRPIQPSRSPVMFISRLLAPLLSLLLILLVVGPLLAWRRSGRLLPAAEAVMLYQRMCRTARLVALMPRQGETAREHAHRVAAHDHAAAQDVLRLATLYQRVSYAQHHPSPAELHAARAALKRLRRLWWRHRLRLRPLASVHPAGA